MYKKLLEIYYIDYGYWGILGLMNFIEEVDHAF